MSSGDDINLRDQIAEDYHRHARGLGSELSWEDAQRVASADLELVDRYESEAKPKPPPLPQVVETLDEEPSVAEQMARERGDRLVKRPAEEAKPAVETLGDIDYEKRLKLIHRVHAISQRDDRGDYLHPKLARRLEEIHANWTFGVREYRRARSQVEKDRIFFAQLERLCEQSTGRMGPWWVK